VSNLDVIRAWKDEEYRLNLSEDQLAALPDNPAGIVEQEAVYMPIREFTIIPSIFCQITLWATCGAVCVESVDICPEIYVN
jgi:mersacidin/lichenicidin family type 2 lantibiotic